MPNFGQPSPDTSAVPGWTTQGNAPLGYAQPNTGTFTQTSVYPYQTPNLRVGANTGDANLTSGWENQQLVPLGYGQIPSVPAVRLLATTQTAYPSGYALINGTGTIVSWTAPNDGLIHRVFLVYTQHITSTETGGQMQINTTAPDGTVHAYTIETGGAGPGLSQGNQTTYMVQAGTAVYVAQSTALTGGAATFWAEIWGS